MPSGTGLRDLITSLYHLLLFFSESFPMEPSQLSSGASLGIFLSPGSRLSIHQSVRHAAWLARLSAADCLASNSRTAFRFFGFTDFLTGW